MKKKFVLALLCLSSVLTITACGKTSEPKNDREATSETAVVTEDTSAVTEVMEPTESVETSSKEDLNEYEKLAFDFATAVTSKDFETVKSLIYLPSDEFVTVDDIEKGLYDSSFKNIIGSDSEVIIKSSSEDYQAATVFAEIDKEDFQINIVVVDGNNYVKVNNLVIEDYTFTAVRGLGVTIDGISVDEYLSENDGNKSTYVISSIGKTDKTIELSSEYWGTYTETITPSNTEYKTYFYIDNESKRKVYDDIVTLVNNIYSAYESDSSVESIKPYFSENIDPNQLAAFADDLASAELGKYNIKASISSPSDWVDESQGVSRPMVFIYRDDACLRVNLNIVQSWTFSKTGYVSDRSYNRHLTCDVVYENGELKIADYGTMEANVPESNLTSFIQKDQY